MVRLFFRRSVLLGLFFALVFSGCRGDLPDPESERYAETVTAFYTAVAAIQSGQDIGAEEELMRATELAPGEPALWANLGVLSLRRNELDATRERLGRAEELAPDHAGIQMLQAQFARVSGDLDGAVDRLRRAVEFDSTNHQALYMLADVVQQRGGARAEDEALRLMNELAEMAPGNLAVQIRRARLAASAGNGTVLREALDLLAERAHGWPEQVQASLAEAEAAASDPADAVFVVALLENSLQRVPAYREDQRRVQVVDTEMTGLLLTSFVRLPDPEPSPAAPPDFSLAFSSEPLDHFAFASDEAGEASEEEGPHWIGVFYPDSEADPLVLTADTERLQVGGQWLEAEVLTAVGGRAQVGGEQLLPMPGAPAEDGRHAVAPLDYNYSFRMDLAVAGRDGVRLYEQSIDGTLEAVTETALPEEVHDGTYTGIWAADLDLDGDLDLLLGRPQSDPLMLLNRGDGTFAATEPFEAVVGLRDFAWADFDRDGTPDPAFLDGTGQLHVLKNERRGHYRPQELPVVEAERFLALASADLTQDGQLDLLAMTEGGAVYQFSNRADGWERSRLVEWEELPTDRPRGAGLLVADLDNNGASDLITSAGGQSAVWLNHGQGQLEHLTPQLDGEIFDAADLTREGQLELLGLSETGGPQLYESSGQKSYNWHVLRPRAAETRGEQRVNSFGIGGELEVRAGLAYQKLAIDRPRVHVGLGELPAIPLARIVWPNGDVQVEYDLQAGQEVANPQRLKGSCPWIFTHDGENMQYITDFIWSSPLGLSINQQETASVAQTEDWIKIPGDKLAARDGIYDVRITAELWESHFFDYIALLVVDRPEETEVFVDERFAFPPPELDVHVTTVPKRIKAAWDHRGEDVTEIVAEKNDRHLATFERTAYQGLAEEHYVEIDLGEEALQKDQLVLIGDGWVRPTDSSINVASSQGDHPEPKGITLEVPDGEGGWRVARSDLGSPAGKNKTIVIDLEGVFESDVLPRVRLRTNMEIYWDALRWAERQPEAELDTTRLAPKVAELNYRGFSELKYVEERSRAETPVYQELVRTAPLWRDLVGYYTRFGDVLPLIEEVDNRYVIMNAGDELRLKFPALQEPEAGWERDFVLIGDGWVKDGDLNTAFSQTLRPLPSHEEPYPEHSGLAPPLEEDPVYQRHREDWKEYHTRYVTHDSFNRALVPNNR